MKCFCLYDVIFIIFLQIAWKYQIEYLMNL